MFAPAQPRTLPKTAEEATRRYIHVYRELFIGNAAEMIRLEKMTQAFIYRLRKICPRFYETKLPSIINQACSTLLLYDTNKKQDADEFHKSHAIFLSILDEFKKSQPQGDVDFSQEKRRYTEKKRLVTKMIQLKKELEKIDSEDIDCTDIGDEEFIDSAYAKIMNQRDKIQGELKNVAIEIALLEGQDLKPKIYFKLKIPARSILNRLKKEEIEDLEEQMSEFCNQQTDRTAMYFDIGVIDGMFDKLAIAPDRFQKEQIKAMKKDALDAYRAYFREIERAERYLHYDEMLHSKQLMPKTGVIFDPEDLPEELKKQMDEQDAIGERELDQLVDCYGDKICNEKEVGDELADLSGDETVEAKKVQVMERLKQKGIAVDRVKEEPRDDCDIEKYLMSEEYDVDEETADALVDGKVVAICNGKTEYSQEEDDPVLDSKPRKFAKFEQDEYPEYGDESEEHYEEQEEVANGEESDDDIECLGTVEPEDKIKVFQLPE